MSSRTCPSQRLADDRVENVNVKDLVVGSDVRSSTSASTGTAAAEPHPGFVRFGIGAPLTGCEPTLEELRWSDDEIDSMLGAPVASA